MTTKQSCEPRCGDANYTTDPIGAPPAYTTRPAWVRLPTGGHPCPWTGLKRSKLNSLILGANAPVKSVSLRKRGQTKGTRLIYLPSLLGYLHQQMEEGGQ